MTKKVISTGKPSFKEKNDILPQDNGKSKNPGLENSLFSDKALTGAMVPMPIGGKNVKGEVDKSVESYKPNEIFPCTY